MITKNVKTRRDYLKQHSAAQGKKSRQHYVKIIICSLLILWLLLLSFRMFSLYSPGVCSAVCYPYAGPSPRLQTRWSRDTSAIQRVRFSYEFLMPTGEFLVPLLLPLEIYFGHILVKILHFLKNITSWVVQKGKNTVNCIIRFQKCMQEQKWRKFVEIVKSTKLISLWRIWLKFAKIIKSMKIASVWGNVVKSAIYITACISGHKCMIDRVRIARKTWLSPSK